MPGYLSPAVPISSSAVLPQSLNLSFTLTAVYPILRQDYHDGTVEQGMITDTVNPPRPLRMWNLSRRIDVAHLTALLTFWETVTFGGLNAFYFYDPYQPGSGQQVGSNYDATGVSSQGRVLVKFRGDWSHALTVGVRSDVPSLQLVEVA